MNKKINSIISYLCVLSLLLNFNACFRHTVRKEVHEKILNNNIDICNDPINLIKEFPHKSTFYAASRCLKKENERCRMLIQAADCGHMEAEADLNLIPGCYLSGRKRKYPSDSESFKTVLADLNKRAPECGYSTEITPFGYTLIPFGIVIGIPLFIVLYPITCLIHVGKKPDFCNFDF